MTKLPLFEELVASEAATRADYIHRNKRFRFDDLGAAINYDATNPDEGSSVQEVAERLNQNFIHTYNYMFKDSYQHSQIVEGRACNTIDLSDEDRQKIKDIFNDFAHQYYDEDGTLTIQVNEMAEALAEVYDRMTSEIPLSHSGMALGSLFVELGRGDKWKALIPGGIDFARGEPNEDLVETIENAISGPDHSPVTSEFMKAPEETVTIAGVKFPMQKIDGWREHLITNSGYLIDLSKDTKRALEAHIESGKPLDDFKVEVPENAYHLWQFQQPASEEGPKAKKMRQMVREKLDDMSVGSVIDGTYVRDMNGNHIEQSLVSMDVDIMTGLSMRSRNDGDSELKTLKNFMAEHGYKEFSDLVPKDFTHNITASDDHAEQESLRMALRQHVTDAISELRKKAAGNTEIEGLLERAGERLEIMLPRVYEITDQAFMKEGSHELKQSASSEQNPNMYLTMGGTASGKGGLKALAKKECGDDLVVASLDDARSDTDRYWLYLATNNHSDDYKTVEEFAKAHRDLTTKRALAGNYHLLIDGSGVPYENRNDKTTSLFKEHGYDVSVLAAQAPLYINDPQKREALSAEGKKPDDAAGRLGNRLVDELRIVPIEIAAAKHIGFPLATRNAAIDSNVDRFMIQDVSGPVGKAYSLSYVIQGSRQDIEAISGKQGAELKQIIQERGLVPDWVKLPEGSSRDPYYDAKVIRDNQDGTYRVEVITDIRQYVNMVQKGLLCRDAKGPEAWFDNTVHSDIDGHFKGEGGRLRLQSPRGVAETPWVNYQPLSNRFTPNGDTSKETSTVYRA